MDTMSISRDIAACTPATEGFVVEEWHFRLVGSRCLEATRNENKMQA